MNALQSRIAVAAMWLATAGSLLAEETGPAASPAAASSPAEKPSSPAAVSIEQLTQRVRQSVAVITSDGRDGRREGLGSGFVVAPEGLIATNFHVIGEGRAVRVQLADGREFNAVAIHASDRAQDIAILENRRRGFARAGTG